MSGKKKIYKYYHHKIQQYSCQNYLKFVLKYKPIYFIDYILDIENGNPILLSVFLFLFIIRKMSACKMKLIMQIIMIWIMFFFKLPVSVFKLKSQ